MREESQGGGSRYGASAGVYIRYGDGIQGCRHRNQPCLLGKASILVPSPNVAEDHQTKNAMALSEKNAAVLVPDASAGKTLVEEAIALVSDPSAITSLELEVSKLALRNSADIIAGEVLKLAGFKA